MDRLLEMVRADVLDPAAGKTQLAPLIEGLKSRDKDTGLLISFAGERNIAVKIVPDVLEMVFTNLIDNSRQNGAERVDIRVDSVGKNISLLVTDNGQGISQANAEMIFTPFFTTHRDEGGTGLGLAIVRSLLKAYGGDIVLNPADYGAKFTLTIPAVANS